VPFCVAPMSRRQERRGSLARRLPTLLLLAHVMAVDFFGWRPPWARDHQGVSGGGGHRVLSYPTCVCPHRPVVSSGDDSADESPASLPPDLPESPSPPPPRPPPPPPPPHPFDVSRAHGFHFTSLPLSRSPAASRRSEPRAACWATYSENLETMRSHAVRVHEWMDRAENQGKELEVELRNLNAKLYHIGGPNNLLTALNHAVDCEYHQLQTESEADEGAAGSATDMASASVRFVQVGAHVGKSLNDPIWPHATGSYHPRRWDGILVEPNPDSFGHLIVNYGLDVSAASAARASSGDASSGDAPAAHLLARSASHNLCAVNAAISNRSGVLPFYRVNLTGGAGTNHSDASALPYWAHELSSFDREHLVTNQNLLREAPESCKKVGRAPDCLTRAIVDNIIDAEVLVMTFADVFDVCGGSGGGARDGDGDGDGDGERREEAEARGKKGGEVETGAAEEGSASRHRRELARRARRRRRRRLSRPRVLVVDAEGYDDVVLMSYPFWGGAAEGGGEAKGGGEGGGPVHYEHTVRGGGRGETGGGGGGGGGAESTGGDAHDPDIVVFEHSQLSWERRVRLLHRMWTLGYVPSHHWRAQTAAETWLFAM
jgi:hypothetical protein